MVQWLPASAPTPRSLHISNVSIGTSTHPLSAGDFDVHWALVQTSLFNSLHQPFVNVMPQQSDGSHHCCDQTGVLFVATLSIMVASFNFHDTFNFDWLNVDTPNDTELKNVPWLAEWCHLSLLMIFPDTWHRSGECVG